MSKLSIAFDEYLAGLSRRGWHIAEQLEPGRPPSEVRQALTNYYLKPASHELVDFFSWKDGVARTQKSTLNSIQVIPGYYPMDLWEAVSSYEMVLKLPIWPRRLFPFLADGMGHYMALDADAGSVGCGEVFEYLEGYPPELAFPSIRSMLSTYEQAFVEGVAFVEDAESLSMQYDSFAELAKRLNPSIKLWQ